MLMLTQPRHGPPDLQLIGLYGYLAPRAVILMPFLNNSYIVECYPHSSNDVLLPAIAP